MVYQSFVKKGVEIGAIDTLLKTARSFPVGGSWHWQNYSAIEDLCLLKSMSITPSGNGEIDSSHLMPWTRVEGLAFLKFKTSPHLHGQAEAIESPHAFQPFHNIWMKSVIYINAAVRNSAERDLTIHDQADVMAIDLRNLAETRVRCRSAHIQH